MPNAPVSQAGLRPPRGGAMPESAPRRPAPVPRPRFVDACAAVAGIGFGAVVATVITSESHGSLAAPGGLLTAAGRLAAFTGTYLILIMVVLVARLPWLERSVGQDQLIRWHRRVSPWAISLITAHVLLIVLGYTQAARSTPFREIWLLLRSYPDILAAAVGFSLLALAGITSYRAVKRRLRYETWWAVHLYLYIGLALAFTHQIVTGVTFVGHPLARGLWIAIWVSTAGSVLLFRIGQPAWRSLRHRLRVVEVRDEAPGVVSVVCRGRDLDKLPISGGQFFLWRFLTRELWWQAHPYSLSALPQPPYLRFTVKGLGDSSRALAQLRPGTRVAFEGPYGAFTDHARLSDGVLLIAAGVGVTPLRALLEDLPAHAHVVVIIRASTVADVVHRAEIAALVEHRGGRLHEMIGSRHKVRINARTLRHLVPDLADRDVYICGPEGFGAEVITAAYKLGVADDQIHTETFSF
ncbi:MAG TPA: ferredoxin reductase family protein [Streptosporangiaceae bacterium]